MTKLLLKVKAQNGQHVVNSLTPSSTLTELKELLSPLVNIPVPHINLRCGFPPRVLESVDNTITLADLNIKSGDSLIVEEKVPSEQSVISEVKLVPPLKENLPPSTDQEDRLSGGLLMRQVVPADNSCLFTSLGFVLGGKVDTTCGTYMRQIIAEELRNNEDEYSEAILGKPPAEYRDWILKPETWGGAIELSALSRHYGLEIAVVDTQSGVINKFGEDKGYDYRVFLIYDGIHYDPLYREPLEEGASVQTLFLRTEDKVLQLAEELAVEAKTSKQYTDVNKFVLRCLVCRQQFTGQVQAQSHAQQTGHLSFGEVAN